MLRQKEEMRMGFTFGKEMGRSRWRRNVTWHHLSVYWTAI